jgi:hypothetical protein
VPVTRTQAEPDPPTTRGAFRERQDLIWNIVSDRPMPSFPELPAARDEDAEQAATPSGTNAVSHAILRDPIAESVSRFFPSIGGASSADGLGDARSRRAVEAVLADLGGPPAASSSAAAPAASAVPSSARFSTTVVGRAPRSPSRTRTGTDDEDTDMHAVRRPSLGAGLESADESGLSTSASRATSPAAARTRTLSPMAPVFRPRFPAAQSIPPMNDETLFVEAQRAVREADELTLRVREGLVGEGESPCFRSCSGAHARARGSSGSSRDLDNAASGAGANRRA